MSFIKNVEKALLKEVKSQNVMPLPSGGGFSQYAMNLLRNTNKVDIFAGWAFIAMNHIATSVSATKFFVERENKDGYDVLSAKDHWAAYLLNKPNPVQKSYKAILKLIVMDYLRHGKMYQRAITIDSKIPFQLFGIPSVSIRNNPGTKQGDPMIIDYTLLQGGHNTIPLHEMIYIQDLTPQSYETATIDGKPSMLDAAMDAILNERERMEFNKRFLNRDGKMPYIVTTPESLGETQASTLLSRIQESMESIFRPEILLDNGIQVQSLVQSGGGINSMVEIPNRDLVEQILACFNTNLPIVTGLHANKDTARQTINEYYYKAVEPIAESICLGLTDNFQQYDETIRVSFEPRREQDLDFMLRQNESDIANGLKTPNEILTERGYPTFEGGDTRLIQYGFQTFELVVRPPEIINEPAVDITSESSFAEIQETLKKKLL